MSSFNEADVLPESIESLIQQGIDVYVLDNGSTDGSLSVAQSYLRKGVVGVETILFEEGGREIYNWSGILARKQQIAQTLDHDWFIHVDADEIRMSPWEDVSLKEAIYRVDQSGCNLINFKLFNFRLHNNSSDVGLIESRFEYFSEAESFDSIQVKAWKASYSLDLVSSGGHFAMIPNPKLSPFRFLLKHYPLRSVVQGVRKVNLERKARFSAAEKAKNWHRQYDELSSDEQKLAEQLFWPMDELTLFDVAQQRRQICQEAQQIVALSQDIQAVIGQVRCAADWAHWMSEGSGIDMSEALLLAEIMSELLLIKDAQLLRATAKDCLSKEAYSAVLACIAKESAVQFLEGKPGLAEWHLFTH